MNVLSIVREAPWLRRGETAPFALVPDKVWAVWRAFQLALEGRGASYIASALMHENAAMLGPHQKTWDKESVISLLRNESVTGVSKTAGVIYPQIIPNDWWERVQRAIEMRAKIGGRRGRGSDVSGLLTGLIHCGVCNARMHIVPRPPRNYLVCSAAPEGCSMAEQDYDEFERQLVFVACIKGKLNLAPDSHLPPPLDLGVFLDDVDSTIIDCLESDTGELYHHMLPLQQMKNLFVGRLAPLSWIKAYAMYSIGMPHPDIDLSQSAIDADKKTTRAAVAISAATRCQVVDGVHYGDMRLIFQTTMRNYVDSIKMLPQSTQSSNENWPNYRKAELYGRVAVALHEESESAGCNPGGIVFRFEVSVRDREAQDLLTVRTAAARNGQEFVDGARGRGRPKKVRLPATVKIGGADLQSFLFPKIRG